jgi:hypothetical protein
MRRLALAVIAVIATLAAGLLIAAGCRPRSNIADSAPEVSLRWTVKPEPPTTGPLTLSLELSERLTEGRRPVEGAEVRLEGTMTHPGMAPVSAMASETSPGSYVARMDLSMAGDWVFLVDARLRDGRTLHRQLELPGVRPVPGRPG